MMKKFKFVAVMLAALVALTGFVSCSSDDDESSGGTTTGGSGSSSSSSEVDSSSVRAALVGKYYAFDSMAWDAEMFSKGVATYFTLTDKDTFVVKTSNPETSTTKSNGNSNFDVYDYGDSWTGSFTLTFDEENSSKSFSSFTFTDEDGNKVYLSSSSGNFTEAEGDIKVLIDYLKSPIDGYTHINTYANYRQAYYCGESEPTPNQAAKATGTEVSE